MDSQLSFAQKIMQKALKFAKITFVENSGKNEEKKFFRQKKFF